MQKLTMNAPLLFTNGFIDATKVCIVSKCCHGDYCNVIESPNSEACKLHLPFLIRNNGILTC